MWNDRLETPIYMIEQIYTDRQEASHAAALAIAAALQQQLQSQPEATAIISGGSTPRACYRVLSGLSLDWARVHLLPTDERWLPVVDEHSNECMLRSTLLRGRAASANLVSLYRAGMQVEEACEAVEKCLVKIPRPVAISLVGMGDDGHVASLFPDLATIDAAVNMANEHWLIPVRTAASPLARISLTMSALTCSNEILLLIFGEKKRRIVTTAQADCKKYPITALLQQDRVPVRVLWAP